MYLHQLEAVSWLIKNNGGYLAFSPGCGKTRIVIESFRAWKAQGYKLFVFCPLSLIHTAWAEDIKKFYPELIMCDLHGKNRRDNADVYITNYEALVSQKRTAEIINLLTKHKFVCCLDESSMISNAQAKRVKVLQTMRRCFDIKVLLSGTPASQSETQWHPQISFLKQGILPDSYYAFRNQYLHLQRGKEIAGKIPPSLIGSMLQKGFKWSITPAKREQLLTRLKPVVMWKKLEDCVDMPPEIDQIRSVEMDADQTLAYKSMKNTCIAEIKEQIIQANMAITKIGKLRTITSGFAYTPDGGTQRLPVNEKLNELEQVTKELGDAQAIVFFNFRAEGEDIRERLGSNRVVVVDGALADKTPAINAFREGKYQFLAANIQSLAHGVTLVNSRYCIYYSHSYSAEDFAQSRARIRRIGQTGTCVYIHLLCRGTIDETIYNVLKRKGNNSDMVAEFMRS